MSEAMLSVGTGIARMPLASSVPASRNQLLAALPPAEYAAVAAHLKDVLLPAGKILHEQGEPIGQVYFPHTGMISLVTLMAEGTQVEAMAVGRDGGVGLRTGLGPRIALNRAVVRLPCQASQIAASRWQELVSASTALRDLVMRYTDVVIASTQQAVACKELHDLEARLCRWLLEARDRIGSDTLPLTQEFLAETLGVRRTTVTVVARKLQSAGLIHYRRGKIHIRDGIALEECACDCYGSLRRMIERIEHAEG